jgi:hypothetical protein
MSLAIQVDDVWEVLLPDGWHKVAPLVEESEASSFDTDAYEYMEGKSLLYNGVTGFRFVEASTTGNQEWGVEILGPISSILAVRCENRRK